MSSPDVQNTFWIYFAKRCLRENEKCDFDTLLELMLHSEDRDDMYGAAAVILENYADELLCQCEAMMNDPLRKKEFRRSAEVFRLEEPLNRCSVAQKTSEQIKSNHTRCKKIAQAAGKIR